MRQLIVVMLCLISVSGLLAVDDPTRLVLNDVPRDSKAIPGFVTFVSETTVWEVDATHVISAHRTSTQPDVTIMVIDVPLSHGQTHTQVVVPEKLMKYADVLRFIQGQRFKPKQ
jgi:hypothetical protein